MEFDLPRNWLVTKIPPGKVEAFMVRVRGAGRRVETRTRSKRDYSRASRTADTHDNVKFVH